MTTNPISLCVGHSRTINGHLDGGAESWDNHQNEWQFNDDLVRRVRDKLTPLGIPSLIFNRYQGTDYVSSMSWLAGKIKSAGCTAAIEFHFNSAGPLAHGHEVHYHTGSVKGQSLAAHLESSLSAHFTNPARGAHPLTSADRGWAFVHLTPCPAVIIEPFFGSSQQDWTAIAANPDHLATAIADAIAACYSRRQ